MAIDWSCIGYTKEEFKDLTPDGRMEHLRDLLNQSVDLLENVEEAFAFELVNHNEGLETALKNTTDQLKWIARRLRP